MIEQGGHVISLLAGEMFLVDSTQPSTFVYDGKRSNQISVHLPRDDMLHRFGDVCTGGVAIQRDDPLWLAVRAVLMKMLRGSDNAFHLREAFTCLLGAYLTGHREKKMVSDDDTVLSRALAMIERHYTDPTFGPGELATRLNISTRALQRHFRLLGETPGHRLLNRRLELAYGRLSTNRSGQLPGGIAAVAYEVGFNDLSYFYRAFRKHYGVAPGAVCRPIATD